MKLTIGDWVILVSFLAGFGWAGSNDFDYRKGQADKELARIHSGESLSIK
jgi:hypothetical protein